MDIKENGQGGVVMDLPVHAVRPIDPTALVKKIGVREDGLIIVKEERDLTSEDSGSKSIGIDRLEEADPMERKVDGSSLVFV